MNGSRAPHRPSESDDPGAVPPDAPLLLACRALYQAVGACEHAAAQHLGLGRNDLRALNLLEDGPRSAAWLAGALHLTRPAVTALVDRLERSGWVTRSQDPTDRRAVSIALRPERWQQLGAVYRPIGLAVHASVAHLPPEQHAQLTASLLEVAGALDEAAAAVGAPTGAAGEGAPPARPASGPGRRRRR
ncbi:MarR family winged helix-turn-helix transcriptional regulator [Quadrisphaera sp. KR29]|uniref:MarR family winged helix-turn-helix transcriptional regulator n=1 Tax=Quadrisphaera sp. KR29 TaxID=3461391 RepID=UPI0040449945